MIFGISMLSWNYSGIPLKVTEQAGAKLFNNNFQSQILAFGQKKGRLKGFNKLEINCNFII